MNLNHRKDGIGIVAHEVGGKFAAVRECGPDGERALPVMMHDVRVGDHVSVGRKQKTRRRAILLAAFAFSPQAQLRNRRGDVLHRVDDALAVSVKKRRIGVGRFDGIEGHDEPHVGRLKRAR